MYLGSVCPGGEGSHSITPACFELCSRPPELPGQNSVLVSGPGDFLGVAHISVWWLVGQAGVRGIVTFTALRRRTVLSRMTAAPLHGGSLVCLLCLSCSLRVV